MGNGKYQNKNSRVESKARQAKKRQDYLNSLKANTPCADCGNKYPYYIMEFDHVSGEPARHSSGRRVDFKNMGKERLEGELLRCDIVCGNCHNARTHFRRAARAQ